MNSAADKPDNLVDSKSTILFIYPNQFGYHTDTFKYCELLQYKYHITYFCFDQGFKRIILDNVDVIYIPHNSGKINRLINFYRKIIQITHEVKFDIVFTVQFKFCFFIGLFARAKLKILDFRTGDLSSSVILRKCNNWLLFIDSLFFREISVISEGLRGILHLNPNNTFILPLGGDAFSMRTHDYRSMNLLYVGHLHIRNIYQTIEGMAVFLKRNPEAINKITYTIIGFGYADDEELINNYILKFNLTNIVQFLGRKQYTELVEYFDCCNIGVSYIPITPYYEYQPSTKTFEYINSGLFTIATDTYENRKVISESNGVLCNDDPHSFSLALEKAYKKMGSINENEIRSSLSDYKWSSIVQDKLEPYLLKKLAQLKES